MGMGMGMVDNALPSSTSKAPPRRVHLVRDCAVRVHAVVCAPSPCPLPRSPPRCLHLLRSLSRRRLSRALGMRFLKPNEKSGTAAPSFVTAPPIVVRKTGQVG